MRIFGRIGSILVCSAVLGATGCASLPAFFGGEDPYMNGYRVGVRDAIRRMGGPAVAQYTGPVVQQVEVPPMLRDGMYVPGHKQMVVVQPGWWSYSGNIPADALRRDPAVYNPVGPPINKTSYQKGGGE